MPVVVPVSTGGGGPVAPTVSVVDTTPVDTGQNWLASATNGNSGLSLLMAPGSFTSGVATYSREADGHQCGRGVSFTAAGVPTFGSELRLFSAGTGHASPVFLDATTILFVYQDGSNLQVKEATLSGTTLGSLSAATNHSVTSGSHGSVPQALKIATDKILIANPMQTNSLLSMIVFDNSGTPSYGTRVNTPYGQAASNEMASLAVDVDNDEGFVFMRGTAAAPSNLWGNPFTYNTSTNVITLGGTYEHLSPLHSVADGYNFSGSTGVTLGAQEYISTTGGPRIVWAKGSGTSTTERFLLTHFHSVGAADPGAHAGGLETGSAMLLVNAAARSLVTAGIDAGNDEIVIRPWAVGVYSSGVPIIVKGTASIVDASGAGTNRNNGALVQCGSAGTYLYLYADVLSYTPGGGGSDIMYVRFTAA